MKWDRRKGLMLGKALLLLFGVVVTLLITYVVSGQLSDMLGLSKEMKSQILSDDISTSADLASSIEEEVNIKTKVGVKGPKIKVAGDYVHVFPQASTESFQMISFHTSYVKDSLQFTSGLGKNITVSSDLGKTDEISVVSG